MKIIRATVLDQTMSRRIAIFQQVKVTPERWQSKMLMLSTNVNLKIVRNRVFTIEICRPTGDRWQSKTRFLAILIRDSRLLRAFSIAAYQV